MSGNSHADPPHGAEEGTKARAHRQLPGDRSSKCSASKLHLSCLRCSEGRRCLPQLGEVAHSCPHGNWTGTSTSSLCGRAVVLLYRQHRCPSASHNQDVCAVPSGRRWLPLAGALLPGEACSWGAAPLILHSQGGGWGKRKRETSLLTSLGLGWTLP